MESWLLALKCLGTNCAVLGNHEFDFGLENLEQLIKISNFPRLLSKKKQRAQHISSAGGAQLVPGV